MSTFELIAATLGGTSVLLLAVAWLVKSLISQYLNKDIETYKANIRSESERKIEELKHDLERLSNEHRVTFEALHEKRSAVIAELYSRIVEFYNGIDSFVGVIFLLEKDEDIEKEAEMLWQRVDSFKNYSEKNRIYFTEEICDLLDQMYAVADGPTSKLMVAAEYQNIDKDGKDTLHRTWNEAQKNLENEVQEVKKLIEHECRKLVGVGNRT